MILTDDEAVAITLRGMTSPTVAGLADSAVDPAALRDSLTDVDRRLLADGLAAEVVEVVEA